MSKRVSVCVSYCGYLGHFVIGCRLVWGILQTVLQLAEKHVVALCAGNVNLFQTSWQYLLGLKQSFCWIQPVDTLGNQHRLGATRVLPRYDSLKQRRKDFHVPLPPWRAAPGELNPQACPLEAGEQCPAAGFHSGPSYIPLHSHPQKAPCPPWGRTDTWYGRQV